MKNYVCQQCGIEYRTYRRNSKFCKQACRTAFMTMPVDFNEIRKLYEKNHTQVEISEILNIPRKVVQNAFKRNGYRTRIPAKRYQTGELNHSWKGEVASYASMHHRVYRVRGKADRCTVCGSHNSNTKYQWANMSGKYNDPNDYEMMCLPCHFRYDGIIENITNPGGKVNNKVRLDEQAKLYPIGVLSKVRQ